MHPNFQPVVMELLPTRTRSEALSAQSFSPPIILESLSRRVGALGLSIGGLYALFNYSASISEVSSRIRASTLTPNDKVFGFKHVWCSSIAAYLLTKATNSSVDLEKVILLSLKTTLATCVVDHFIDESSHASQGEKVAAVARLKDALINGSRSNVGGQLQVAYDFAEEVHRELKDSPRFSYFTAEVTAVGSAVTKQMLCQSRSLAQSIFVGSRSVGLLATIQMALDTTIPTRFLKAARHFGALIEMADDIQDAVRDIENGRSTFATQLSQSSAGPLSTHPTVFGTFTRHAKRCFESLTVPERDAYRALWRLLRYQWPATTIKLSNINPPLKPKVALTLPDSDPPRAVSEHGHYWGPFFIQPRVGHEGRRIMIYKFRTMKAYAPDDANPKLDTTLGKAAHSDRFTRFGNLMRQYFIDEIPQFVNCLKGHLRLIGQRPETWDKFEKYSPQLQAKYKQHGPAAIPVLYGFYGTPTPDDPECNKQRTAFFLEFYRQYEQAKIKTTLKYLFKSAWGIVVERRRGL